MNKIDYIKRKIKDALNNGIDIQSITSSLESSLKFDKGDIAKALQSLGLSKKPKRESKGMQTRKTPRKIVTDMDRLMAVLKKEKRIDMKKLTQVIKKDPAIIKKWILDLKKRKIVEIDYHFRDMTIILK